MDAMHVRTARSRRWTAEALLTVSWLLVLAVGCGADPTVGATREAIIGGATEAGYPAVGALMRDEPGIFTQFCTATLIEPDWVLTAAHCWSASGYRADQVSFFVGTDATSRSGGTTYRADAYYLPPGWMPAAGMNDDDIALVHLASSVVGVTPLDIGTEMLSTSTDLGRPLTWVGFGDNNGAAATGNGIKRSVAGTMGFVLDTYFSHGTSTCHGDSGGPALSSRTIVGVAQGVLRSDCTGLAFDTRVDVFAGWIADTIALHTPCSLGGGDCGERACFITADGGTGCMPTDGGGSFARCNPSSDRLGCADGLVCGALTSSTDGVCLRVCDVGAGCADGSMCDPLLGGHGYCVPQFCMLPSECAPDQECQFVLGDRTDIGICRTCTDMDADGACVAVDCRDDDASVHPGAREQCANGVDDDCDGAADARDTDCAPMPSEDGGTGGGVRDGGTHDGGAPADGAPPPVRRTRGGCAVVSRGHAASGGRGIGVSSLLLVIALAFARRRFAL